LKTRQKWRVFFGQQFNEDSGVSEGRISRERRGSMLNIVIPMAGRGSRFAEAGYLDPKPLIPIHGKPMIQWVIRNLSPKTEHRFIFIAQGEHLERYQLREKLNAWAPGSIVIALDEVTDGAARTVLMAKNHIDTDEPLVIANSDQWIEADINDFLGGMLEGVVDGTIMTMTANDPKWSFVAVDESGFAERVVEKEVISNLATVGIYGFTRGSDFVAAAESMIRDNFKVNNEFYVAPAYNWMISQKDKINTFSIGAEAAGMYGLGIPADLLIFSEHPISKRVW
jgi:dTDP-glucose pyrophosphorylase